ncbi:MAG: Flp pilus assembly protein CpaB [Mariniblastus sp.]
MSKVNSGTILLAFIAVLFGLGGTYLLRKSMQKTPAVVADVVQAKIRPPQKLTVPMTSRSLEAGHRVALDDIALVRLSREDMKKYGIKSAFMTNPDQIIGKTLKEALKRGDTFDTKYFFPSGVGMGIAQRIKPGQRAITVSLTPTNALMGFAGAGQMVDVLFHYGEDSGDLSSGQAQGVRFDPTANSYQDPTTGMSGSGRGRSDRRSQREQEYQSATVTIVQNAEILALGDKAIPTGNLLGVPGDQRIPVTLLLSPGDAQKVKVADGHGELSLTLRSPTDREHVQLADTAKLDSILKMEDRVMAMQVFRGRGYSEMQFDSTRSLSPRIVDSPAAYDPSKADSYDPESSSPWVSKNGIPSKPVSSRLVRPDGSQPRTKPQPLFESEYKPEGALEPVIERGIPTIDQPRINLKGDTISGPLSSANDEINQTLEMFGSVLGGNE